MQRLREKIKIEPGDAAAMGEDKEEGYGKRQRQRRWNEDDRILGFGRWNENLATTRSVGQRLTVFGVPNVG
ncbi:hypothetical protein D8674_003625 [Pyrus ussuriensis x Pyrus communis]|uniref:Uncharacterized protein n=1 Tax=Pyrus ussuriensis x Pyrus communis TaxID=2448454 RepID=A0A5N5FMV5_9ROSA|nr:hypothetical protein D8674_003625 [Pyrus ussuriensis x Pyrus communis]